MANSLQTHTITKGDTRTPVGVTLKQSGTAVNLTGLTVKFKMLKKDGTVKVAETSTNVSVTSAASGQVQYDFQSADVDTAGTYYCWFTVYAAGDVEKDHFPNDGPKLRIEIVEAAP